MVLFSKILKKPSIVVAGGYDVASYPEIDYGAMRGGLRKWMGRMTFSLADHILSVSSFNHREVLTNARVKGEKVSLIPLGLPPVPRPEVNITKKKRVVTIGVIKRSNLRRKGLLTVVQAARFLPKREFLILGADLDGTLGLLKRIATPNVKFLGYVSEEEKDRILWESKVYVQPSYHEAFGVAVAEAMLRECIPVVTRRGALPYLVGDTGFYAERQDPAEVAERIERAMDAPEERGKKARERILRYFTLEKRKRLLHDLLVSKLNGRMEVGVHAKG
jgi:glycosyltransferase involved in cell wall biosynthesis